MPPEVSLAAIRAADTGVGGRRRGCCYARMVQDLKPKERRELAEAMADPMISSKAIWRVLRARGFKETHYVITKHRDNQCHHCSEVAAGKKNGTR